MPIRVDTYSNSGRKTGNPYSWSHTTASGANLMIVCTSIHTGGGGRTVSGITYGGDSFTYARAVEPGGFAGRVEIWYLKNPSSGANTVTVTFSSSPSEGAASALTVFDAHPDSPFVSYYDGTNGSSTPSTTITAVSGGIAVDSLISDTNPANTPGTNQVEMMQVGLSASGDGALSSYKLLSNGGSDTMTWSASTNHAVIASVFKAKDEGGSFIYNLL